jgi:hypothetical protein
MTDVTRLLDAAAAGDRKAAADLLPLVYDEMRKLAWLASRPTAPSSPPHSTKKENQKGVGSLILGPAA